MPHLHTNIEKNSTVKYCCGNQVQANDMNDEKQQEKIYSNAHTHTKKMMEHAQMKPST